MQPTQFVAGTGGEWQITDICPIAGEGIDIAPTLQVVDIGNPGCSVTGAWTLRGSAGSLRYTTRAELDRLSDSQPGLGRKEARLSALIPIRKSPLWWALAQDERRAIIEERSNHFRIGMDYLPAIARKLYHSRDLGEPFDFLTWFEFSPEHARSFDVLLSRLRPTEEWRYVEREVEIRLCRHA